MYVMADDVLDNLAAYTSQVYRSVIFCKISVAFLVDRGDLGPLPIGDGATHHHHITPSLV